jgi:hypothetical protein
MTGIPHFNFPKFNRIAAELRAKGHHVFNPAERDIERHNGVDVSADNPTGSQEVAVANHAFSLGDALSDDLSFVTKGGCTAIYFLDGWEHSSGALSEFFTARAMKRKFFYEGQDVPHAAS